MPKPLDPEAWHPEKPPIAGRDYAWAGTVGFMAMGMLWRHKKLSAALMLLLALLIVVVVGYIVLRVTGTTPSPAQTGPTPTLLPANGGP